ncbi:MAG: hypothetical protein ABH886_02270 [Candidatus Desantisbacteria bacterium]
MKCFYHNDLDGRCSGAIVNLYRRNQENDGTGFYFIEIDYKDRFPLETISPNEEIWIVDFSLKPEVMNELLKVTQNIIWIDHHATAKEYGYADLKGLRDFKDKGNAGCELTWQYCFPDRKMPSSVLLIGDYDKWALKMQPECFEFYEGLKLEDTNVKAIIWKELFSDDTLSSDIIHNGKTSIKYRDNYCSQLRKSFGYETEIDGYKAYATNMYMFGSKGFGHMMDNYPLCIAYIHDGKMFTVSCYSTKIDVSVICKNHGGGGHKGAAGFITSHLPFKKENHV